MQITFNNIKGFAIFSYCKKKENTETILLFASRMVMLSFRGKAALKCKVCIDDLSAALQFIISREK